ncbi:hypothetical protein HY969_02320 [Candidatus Kaiserbacteria bacterium]|nr:hypothetical protein [Candidatus Kaiserbacteria bacterium]
MPEVLWRLLWIACIAALIAYASFLFFGSVISKSNNPKREELITVDVISVGKHDLKGVIIVPSECHGVTQKTIQESPSRYHIQFTTWQEPYRDCPKIPAIHAFDATVFAPAVGVDFFASLDGKMLNMNIVESYVKNGASHNSQPH